MVCDRCKMTVRKALEDLNYSVLDVSLGEAEIDAEPSGEEMENIEKELRKYGFELVQDSRNALVEQIKSHLIHYRSHIENSEHPEKLSTFLSEKLHHNYSYLSNLFSSQEGITIEQYVIKLKIERVKELLSYGELTLSEIAWKLNYSSVQYLSNQFKKVTGETVSSFKKHLDSNTRKSLDAIH